jgi:hypothetical protein
MKIRAVTHGPPFRPTSRGVVIELTEPEAHRVNTILLRHSVGVALDLEDTKANRYLAGELSNAIEEVLPRPIDNASPNGDEL